jgi:competence protein ComEA
MKKHHRVIRAWTVVLMGLIIAASAYAGEADKIDINTATADQLTRLKGIGSSHAAAIVAYRQKSGPFQKPEDLMNVPRIGPKIFENNRALITVQTPKKQQAKK